MLSSRLHPAMFISLIALLALPALSLGATYYVDAATGDDTANDCSVAASPCKTISHAASQVPAGAAGSPNQIMVAAGLYDQNSETFPITFTNDYISLTGAGAATTTIDVAHTALDALVVDGTGFSVSGFTFKQTVDGIDISEGGFTIADNVFESTIQRGVNFFRFDTNLNSSVSFADMTATGNTFRTSIIGFRVSLYLDFDNITQNLTAAFGDLTLSGNTFSVTGGDGIDINNLFYVSDLLNSTVTAGHLTITGNTFTGGDNGITFYSGITDVDDSRVTVGNTLISNNTFTDQSSTAIEIDYWDIAYLYNTSAATLGELTISQNTISSDTTANPSSAGIILDDLAYMENIYDTATVRTGSVNITNNSVQVADFPLYMEYSSLYEIGVDNGTDTVSLILGPNNIVGNTLTSSDHSGASIYLNSIAHSVYADATINLGPFTFSGNGVSALTEALDIVFDYVGYEMYNNANLSMAPWTIIDNTLTSTSDDSLSILYEDYNVGSYMEDDAAATLPDWVIRDNHIDTRNSYNGVSFYTYSNPADIYHNTTFRFGSILVDNNSFNPNTDSGMDRAIDFWIEDVCVDCYDAAAFTHGDITITNNNIYNAEDTAIRLDYDDIGYAFNDTGSVTMGNVTVADNLIDTAPDGIITSYNWPDADIGDDATVTLGTLDITDNLLTDITDTAINAFFTPAITDSTATLVLGKATISDNTVRGAKTGLAAQSTGILIDGTIGLGVMFDAPTINNNTTDGFHLGISLDSLPEATFRCNTAANNSESGLQLTSNGTFTAIYNIITDNGLGLKVASASTATVTAEKNWWGDRNGPVACLSCNEIDAGGGSVDFDPWLTSVPSGALCGGFPWQMFMPALTGMKP